MKILFLHGFASSGAYKMASSLRILVKGSEVIAPDLPMEPSEAFELIEGICLREQPDLVVGLSMGGFWAQKLRGYRKILVNPDFHFSRFLRTTVGTNDYLSPRLEGASSFIVTDSMCDGFAALETEQFSCLDTWEIGLTTGLFADHDELVDCSSEFLAHYPGRLRRYPGGHLPNYPQLKQYLLPVICNEVPDQPVH